ncbi:MAG: glycosyltransferase [Gemmatimonadaceae bacterium]
MTAITIALLALPAAALGYAYVLYPVGLWCLVRLTRAGAAVRDEVEWPEITVTIPVHNEERTLRSTLELVLALDYPAHRRHVLVISDASTDGTDEIARTFGDRGVRLVRLPSRAGKTAAENAAVPYLRGEIVVNVDAAARPAISSLRALVATFADPTVGVASGRDVSLGTGDADTGTGESGYVGYEMWVRDLETRMGSIVGASGCFFAVRRALYEERLPEALSRDFASAMIAREHGLRSVSVHAAVCGVPRALSMDAEFRRKVRTMHRGLETLWYKRALLNPVVYGRFAVMLFSHKLCRWLVPLTLPLGALGLALLAMRSPVAASLLGVVITALALSAMVAWRPGPALERRGVRLPSYLLMSSIAGIVAWWEALRQKRESMWEPTRRPV